MATGSVIFRTIVNNQITRLCTKFGARRLFRRKVLNVGSFDNIKFVTVKTHSQLAHSATKNNYNAVISVN